MVQLACNGAASFEIGPISTLVLAGQPTYEPLMGRLELLKEQAQVNADYSFGLSAYIGSARKVYAEATLADGEQDFEGAYTGFLKYARILQIILSHPEYGLAKKERNKDHFAFQELQAKWVPVKQRMSNLEAQITEGAGPAPSMQAFVGSMHLHSHQCRSSPARSSPPASPPLSTNGVKRDSISERIAGLRSAGLELGSSNKKPRALPLVEEKAAPRRPLPTVPTPSSGMVYSAASPPMHLDEQRPGSAPPATPTFGEPAPNVHDLSPNGAAQEEDNFAQMFPTLNDLEHRFPDLPSTPTHDPAQSNGGLGRPPAAFPSQTPPQSSGPISPQSQTSRSIPSRRPLAPVPAQFAPPTPQFNLPKSLSILPSDLWSYISASVSPSILLIDVRPRPAFERLRISTNNHPNVCTICMEPIILRQPLTSQQLESALFDSDVLERQQFKNRSMFDLVVFYDESTQSLPQEARIAGMRGLGGVASAPELWTLNQAIYVQEFKAGATLKRPPVLLVGGLEAWKRDVGSVGLQGKDVDVREAARTLEGSTPPRSTGVSGLSSTEKKQNRKMTLSGSEAYAAIPINRSLGDVIGNAYSATGSSFQPAHAPPPLSAPQRVYQNPQTLPETSFPQFPQQAMQRLPSSKSLNASLPLHSSMNGLPPSHTLSLRNHVEYPTLRPAPPIPEVQRPPLAQLPSVSYNSRPGYNSPHALAPQNRRISSATYGSSSLPGSPIASKIPLDWRDGVVGLTGLKNLGNTCYMNSTLQCLSATVPFANFFTDGRYRQQINMINPLGTKGALASAVSQLFSALWREQFTFVSPITFRDAICHFAPQFRGTDQHDSQEFLAFLLDGLHEDLNLVLQKPKNSELTPEREAELEALPPAVASNLEWERYLTRDNSLIVNYFQGQYRSRLQCLTCGKTSTTYNAFMYLSLPIPASKKPITLEAAVSAFASEEILDKQDAWHCPNCKQPRKASKRLTLARLPPILLIHLKRFSFKGPFSDKIDTPVQFPIFGLDLSPHLPPASSADNLYGGPGPTPPSTYDLYGVSQHFGTLSSGHYTAFVRSRQDWHHISDAKVQQVNEEEVRKAHKSSYILWYRRN